MKVMELCLSDGVGGLELYVLRTAKQLSSRGVECMAVVSSGTMLAKRMQEDNVAILPMKRAKGFFPYFAAKKLAALIDEQQVDILHMHWGKDIDVAVWAKKLARRPVKLVYTRQMMITRAKHDIYHKSLYKHVDLFITITDQLAGLAKQYLPLAAEKIQRLYYGVDEPEQFVLQERSALREQLGIGTDKPFAIGLVGRIEDGKGQHILIEAVHSLKNQGVPVCAVIIGPAMNEHYLQRIQRQVQQWDLGGNIIFYGPHKNPTQVMPAFDAVVLLSREETFGLVLIEAMRSNVAVVGTNAGGVPEIIDDGKTGLLVQPGSAQDLEEKLLFLSQHEVDRSRLATAGKEKADRLFSTNVHYDQLVAYMKNLL